MKRILSLLLAVVMVALMIPFAAMTASAAYATYTATPVYTAQSAISADGVMDLAYRSATPIEINQNGVSATAYVVYDNSFLYFFVDVNDSTRMVNYYHQQNDKDGDGVLDTTTTPYQSQMETNDCVVIGFNASGENLAMCLDPAADGDNVNTKTAVVGGYRLVSADGATVYSVNLGPNFKGGGFNSNSFGTVETETGCYTAEFKLAFKDAGITKADVEGDNFGFMIQVNDRTAAPTDTNKDANMQRAFSNPSYTGGTYLYKWRSPTLSPIKNGGFDKLVSTGAYDTMGQTLNILDLTGTKLSVGWKEAEPFHDTFKLATPFVVEQNGIRAEFRVVMKETYSDTSANGLGDSFIAIYADVTDTTVQSEYYSNSNGASVGSVGTSQMFCNDGISFAINATGDPTNSYGADAGASKTSDYACIVNFSRPLNGADGSVNCWRQTGGSQQIFWNYSFCVFKNKADGTGYTAKLYMPYHNGNTTADIHLTRDKIMNSTILIAAVDSNNEGAAVGSANFNDFRANIKRAYTNPAYVNNWTEKPTNNGGLYYWKQATIMPAIANGFNPVELGSIVEVTVNGANPVTLGSGQSFTLPAAPSVAAGEQFLGWTNTNGTIFVPANASVVINESTDFTPVVLKAETLDGAAVRLDHPSGLRFTTSVDVASYDALSDSVKGRLAFGAVMFPADMLNGAELTKNSTYTSGDNTYSAVSVVKTDVANQKTENDEHVEVYSIRCVLSNINASNYDRDITARGFIDVAYTNGATATIYLGTTTRNVKSVAQAALDSGNHTSERDLFVLNTFVGNN